MDKYGKACWSDTPSTTSYKTSIRKDRQLVGIPMGKDCAPILANQFLFYYEYEYMKNLVKDNLQSAMKFNGTMRYIDDLLTLNNSGLLVEYFLILLSWISRKLQILLLLYLT